MTENRPGRLAKGLRHGRHLFTSESVCRGHPDKICDQVSDGILDAIIEQDPFGRVACECMVKTGYIVVAGEISTSARFNPADVARQTIKEIGYDNSKIGFDWETCAVLVALDRQSPDIALGVDESKGLELGAGDQGTMFGFACSETPELMPLPITLAHRICMKIDELRVSGTLDYLRPDGKCQVTVEYEDDTPIRLHTVVCSAQHSPDVPIEKLREDIIEKCIHSVTPKELLDERTIYHINPTGRFVVGGPQGDCGLTGRKIIVDTYGGRGSHGGGCFSGKDPTKVDRSGSYMARYIAKNIVSAGIAERCEVQLSYAIGVAQPVSLLVCTEMTSKVPEPEIEKVVSEMFDLRPRAIIDYLDLRRPIFKKTACYGHFGRELPEFTWERVDRFDELRRAVGL